MWLTTVLRPAGRMDDDGAEQFATALQAMSACSSVVLVDLQGVGPLPRSARRALEEADVALSRAGGALLVADPDARQRLPTHLLRPGLAVAP